MVTKQKFMQIWSCTFSGGVARRSFLVALVVGTILNLINQGDALLAHTSINWFKIILTYFVPYGVCTYGAVSMQLVPSMLADTKERRDTAYR